jgi:hypothetical protein
MREWPDALRRAARKLRGMISSMRDHLARLEREGAAYARVKTEFDDVSAQLALFDLPPAARRRAAA